MKDMKVTDKRCLELSLIVLEGIPGVKFDMETYRKRCGTAGCIGGYAVATYNVELWRSHKSSEADIGVAAAKLLGLDRREMAEMFYPWLANSLRERREYAPSASGITPEMAAETLRHFAATGKIMWRHR